MWLLLREYNTIRLRTRCLFFFDCCLVAKSTEDIDESPQASKMFKLTAPVKCLVAYATAMGYDIITTTTDEEPPHYESCLGSVNLKGNIYVKTIHIAISQ